MVAPRKVYDSVLTGRSDANFRFSDLRRLVLALGFAERIKGDHYIFTCENVLEIINLQPGPDGKAKSYQVKQVRQLITTYGLKVNR